MGDEHSFVDHWKRGALVLFRLGVIIFATAMLMLIAWVVIYGVSWVVLPRATQDAFIEVTALPLSLILFVLVAPWVISQGANRWNLILSWPPKPQP
jgi:hypothetical protein